MFKSCKTPHLIVNNKASSTSKIVKRKSRFHFNNNCLCNHIKIVVHAPNFIIDYINKELKGLFPHECDLKFIVTNPAMDDMLNGMTQTDKNFSKCSLSHNLLNKFYEPIYKTPIQSKHFTNLSPVCSYKASPFYNNQQLYFELKSKHINDPYWDKVLKDNPNPFEKKPSSYKSNFISPNFIKSLKYYHLKTTEKARIKTVHTDHENNSFKWSIGERANMFPIDIENSPSFWQHFNNDKTQCDDLSCQKAIDKYFSSPLNICSPAVPNSATMVSTSTQTILSIPSFCDTSDLLNNFVLHISSNDTFNTSQQDNNTSVSSKRKLFTPTSKLGTNSTPNLEIFRNAQTESLDLGIMSNGLFRTPSLSSLTPRKITSSPMTKDYYYRKRLLKSRTIQSPFTPDTGRGRPDIESPTISPIKEDLTCPKLEDFFFNTGEIIGAVDVVTNESKFTNNNDSATSDMIEDDISDRTRNLSISLDDGDGVDHFDRVDSRHTHTENVDGHSISHDEYCFPNSWPKFTSMDKAKNELKLFCDPKYDSTYEDRHDSQAYSNDCDEKSRAQHNIVLPKKHVIFGLPTIKEVSPRRDNLSFANYIPNTRSGISLDLVGKESKTNPNSEHLQNNDDYKYNGQTREIEDCKPGENCDNFYPSILRPYCYDTETSNFPTGILKSPDLIQEEIDAYHNTCSVIWHKNSTDLSCLDDDKHTSYTFINIPSHHQYFSLNAPTFNVDTGYHTASLENTDYRPKIASTNNEKSKFSIELRETSVLKNFIQSGITCAEKLCEEQSMKVIDKSNGFTKDSCQNGMSNIEWTPALSSTPRLIP